MISAVEAMAKAIRKEFVDHIVDHANPHWGASKPDYLKNILQKAGYTNAEAAADFFARAAAKSALAALGEVELPDRALAMGFDVAGCHALREEFRAIIKALADAD